MSEGLEERARQFIKKLDATFLACSCRGEIWECDQCVAELWELLKRVRRETMEQDAEIADQWTYSKSCTSEPVCDHMRTGAGIAAAIRSRIPDKS